MINWMTAESRMRHIRHLAETVGRDGLTEQLTGLARQFGEDRFREMAADDLMTAARPGDAVPSAYAAYRPIVTDGIRYLFAHLSLPRLIDLIADQAGLDSETPPGARLLRLATQMPTLHKLGQTIARNPHLDESLRRWLVELENGPGTGDVGGIRREITDSLGSAVMADHAIEIEDRVVAEASVGAVVPFGYRDRTGKRGRGVFKVLKPGVRERLDEELSILDAVGRYLDGRRDRYPLADFRFIETFADVRTALSEEANLSGEQANLCRAIRFYGSSGTAHVPAVLPFSTPTVTAMGLMPGGKVTDAAMSPTGRRRAIRTLVKALCFDPVFSAADTTPVHGDPHAGNLFAISSSGAVGLLDWSLAGSLTKAVRVKMVTLMRGVVEGDPSRIAGAAADLAGEDGFMGRIRPTVDAVRARPDFRAAGYARRVFLVIDALAVTGVRFPSDLMLFRKAFFTLDGVLRALDPEFDLDACLIREMAGLMIAELPRRWVFSLFPGLDRADHYRSLMSNRDLWHLGTHLFFNALYGGAAIAGRVLDDYLEGVSAAPVSVPGDARP